MQTPDVGPLGPKARAFHCTTEPRQIGDVIKPTVYHVSMKIATIQDICINITILSINENWSKQCTTELLTHLAFQFLNSGLENALFFMRTLQRHFALFQLLA